jgi:hypothetical protein
MPRRSLFDRATWIVAIAMSVGSSAAESMGAPPEPPQLRQRIDSLIDGASVGLMSAPAGDAEFLRRVSIDLVGMIPSAAEARLFLADASPNKRELLVEKLLTDPRHARHMAIVFDVALMERRTEKHVPAAEWRKFLYESFLANKPYDQLVREILSADGVDAAGRAAARFVLDRECEPNLLARDVGRVFFGKDFQCCQCHDHPLVSDYYQSDYYGLFTFFGRSSLFNDEKQKKMVIADKAAGETSFVSVFDRAKTQYQGRPRVPGGVELDEPSFKPGEEYVVKPADKVRPVPKFSRRAKLAEQATRPGNRVFNENIANRVWAMLMGRGLVEPVDMHHAGNPPSHPDLLALVGEEFQAGGYDLRALVREIALTRAYQRSIDLPGDVTSDARRVGAQMAAWEAEHKRLAEVAAAAKKASEPIEEQLLAARKRVAEAAGGASQAQSALAQRKKDVDATSATLLAGQKELAAKQDLAKSVAEAAAKGLEAAKKAVKDTELQAAAQKFQQRAAELQSQVASMTKTVANRQAARDKAVQEHLSAEKSSANAAKALADANRQVGMLQAERAALAVKLATAEAAAEQAGARLADAKAVIEVARVVESQRAAEEAVAAARREVAAAKSALDAQVGMAQKLADEMAVAQKALDESQQAVAKAQAETDVARLIATNVAEALAKTRQALAQLANDVELAGIADRLAKRAEPLGAELKKKESALLKARDLAATAAQRQATAQSSVEAANAQASAMRQRVGASEAALKQNEERVAGCKAELDEKRKTLVERSTRQFAIGSLKPLATEQLAYSVMRAVGMVDQQQAAADAEWAKKNAKANLADAAVLQTRARDTESIVHEKLAGNVAPFLPLFSTAAGQPQGEFFATADQALFFANGGQIRGWLAPGGGNLTERLIKQTDVKLLSEELYLSVLTRNPTSDEIADVTRYLAERTKDRNAAIGELVWSLLTSTEFRFSH